MSLTVLRELGTKCLLDASEEGVLGRGLLPHLTDGKTEAQQGKTSSPRSHRQPTASSEDPSEKHMPSTLLAAAWEMETVVTSILQRRKPTLSRKGSGDPSTVGL